MLSDEVIDKVTERLVNRVEQANTYFLKQLGSKVKQIKKLTPSEAHKLVQILKYGGEYNDIVKKISKYTDLNIKEIDKIFKEFSKKDQAFAKDFYEYRNKPYIPYEQNVTLKRQTEALARIVKNEMYDFTRSKVLGYTITDLDGKVRFKGLKEIYNQVLDTAVLNVSQGKETFDSAMSRILADIGGSGLRTIEYESGRHIRLDSAIRMHTKARLRELHNENQQLFGEEFDSDGVEISTHTNPAPDHAPVQGRQFSTIKPSKNKLSEWEKLQAGKDAVAYNGVTYNLDHDAKNGYRPISELNCYHYTFAIVLGVSAPEYTDEELQQIIDDNNKGFELDGKHYTMYEGTQLQRGLERKIREQKDIQILAKESDNKELIAKSQNNITTLTNKYKELSQASGLPTKANRLKVSGYKRARTNPKNTTEKQNINVSNDLPKSYNDLTNTTNANASAIINIDRTMNFSVDSNGIKHDKFYYEQKNTRLEEEKKYRAILESKLNHKVYRNPKPIGDFNKSADFWVEDLDETWDLKGIDGSSKNVIENSFSTASKRKQTPNIVLHKRKTPHNIEKLKEETIYLFEKNKKPYIKQVMLFDENDELVLYLQR